MSPSCLSRRSALAAGTALAAASTANVVVITTAAKAADDDPIFAAIKQHRIAEDVCIAVDGDIPDDKVERLYECKLQLAIKKPTTPAGMIAVLRYQRGYTIRNGITLFGDLGEHADPRCDTPAWLALLEQSIEEIELKRARVRAEA